MVYNSAVAQFWPVGSVLNLSHLALLLHYYCTVQHNGVCSQYEGNSLPLLTWLWSTVRSQESMLRTLKDHFLMRCHLWQNPRYCDGRTSPIVCKNWFYEWYHPWLLLDLSVEQIPNLNFKDFARSTGLPATLPCPYLVFRLILGAPSDFILSLLEFCSTRI